MQQLQHIVRNTRACFAAAAVFLLAGTAACIDFGLGLDPTVGGLLQSVVREGEALPEFARAAGGSGTMRVSGQIVGRLSCDYIDSDLEESGGDLRLTLTIISGRQGCNSLQPTTISYLANIFNLDPGPTGIVVEHRYEGVDGVAGKRLDTVVDVK